MSFTYLIVTAMFVYKANAPLTQINDVTSWWATIPKLMKFV